MTQYIPTSMRARIEPAPSVLVVNVCSENDSTAIGDATHWAWANPTNRATRTPIAGTGLTAASTECTWQGCKLFPGTRGLTQTPEGYFLSEEDFLAANRETLEGNWRRGKGKKPIGAWAGPDLPLITDPTAARRTIYLPAYAAQLTAMEQHPGVQAILAHAGQFETVYLRDFNTGGIESRGAMGHARLLAGWLANRRFG